MDFQRRRRVNRQPSQLRLSDVGSTTAAAGPAFPTLWPATWKLLRLRLRIWVNGFRRARRRDKILRSILFLGLAGLLALGIYLSSWLLGLLRSPEFAAAVPNSAAFIDGLPVLVMGGAFLGILLTSFGVLLQSLYLAGDMDFLLSAPIPIRAVFLTKLLQAILPNLGLMSLLSLPLLFGLGAMGGFHAAYYPLVVIALAALSLAGAGLASLLVMGIVRLFPARRVAEVLGFVGATLSILCSQSGQLAGDANRDQMARTAEWLARFDTPWSPLAWAGRGVVQIGHGEWLPGLAMLGLTLALAGVVFLFALTMAERLYYTGWASLSTVRTRRRAARPAVSRPGRGAGARRASPVWAIVLKDFTVLRRDLRNLSQMVTPIVLGIVYTVLLIRGGGEPPPGRGEAPGWFMEGFRDVLSYGDVAIAMFVGWVLLGRLAAIAFSQEGRSYWILKTAPVSAARLMAAKFASAFLPATALGWGFVLVLTVVRQSSFGHALFSLAVVAACFFAATGINLAFGIAGAVFEWEDPRQMQRSAAGCLSLVASTAGVGVCVLLFFGPVIGAVLLGLSATAGQLVGVVLGGAASAACALLPLRLVRRRVERLGET
jgi:ABC-2 type transport system permease protein